jgi:hypothetical protein
VISKLAQANLLNLIAKNLQVRLAVPEKELSQS